MATYALVLFTLALFAPQSPNQQFLPRLLNAAHERTTHTIRYEPA